MQPNLKINKNQSYETSISTGLYNEPMHIASSISQLI